MRRTTHNKLRKQVRRSIGKLLNYRIVKYNRLTDENRNFLKNLGYRVLI